MINLNTSVVAMCARILISEVIKLTFADQISESCLQMHDVMTTEDQYSDETLAVSSRQVKNLSRFSQNE